MKGLYVDSWRRGLKTKEEVDEMLDYAEVCGITDLFIHKHRDWGNADWQDRQLAQGFDYLQYIIANKKKMKIHAWVTTLEVGRLNAWVNRNYNPDTFMLVPSRKYGYFVYLDPMIPEVQQYVINKVCTVVQNYPGLDGIHIEKLRYPHEHNGAGTIAEAEAALTYIIQQIRLNLPNMYISIPIRAIKDTEINCGRDSWQEWKTQGYINDVMPMLLTMSNDRFTEILQYFRALGINQFSLGCQIHGLTLEDIATRGTQIKDSGASIIFYSLESFASD